jgi:hypothetical protein
LAAEGEKIRFTELLGRRLRNGHDIDAKQCPDAAILAAYYERTLPTSERIAWESHFAGCSRCRAGLAAMARVDAADRPPARINVPPWWKMRIPLPIAAAAVAVGLVVMVRALSSKPVAVVTEPASSTYSQTESRDQAGPLTRLKREPSNVAEKALALNQSNRRETAAAPQRAETPSVVAPAPAAASPMAAANMRQNAGGDAAITGGAPGSPTNEIESKSLAAPTADGGASAIGGAVTGSRAAMVAKSQSAKARRDQESALLGATAIEIAPPNHSVVWMVGAHGMIMRVVKGAALATPQRSGVDADLTAGFAPSSSVCWVVGRGGVITRTVDGEHWTRVASPTGTDLVGVSARSASEATIIAAGGQGYATTNGGATWRPL